MFVQPCSPRWLWLQLLRDLQGQTSIAELQDLFPFGDVERIIDQTQVLNGWYFWPLQLFCANFGGTHGVHHFVVGLPFYLRPVVSGLAHKAMRKYGVRFNDLGTFRRLNRIRAKIAPHSLSDGP
jgi:hypothetical protein